ncbi:MAG: hypothetical protein AB7J13_16370 [Pyrinomonadaceae bacterium]
MKRKINLDELHKVEASSILPLASEDSDVVQAIVKVREPSYVPPYVRVRASIGPEIFTGELKFEDLESLEQDPKVESVSIRKKLKSSR